MTGVVQQRPLSDLHQLQATAVPDADAESARQQVRRSLSDGTVKIAVVDDDSTGTQAVSGIPLLTGWERSELLWAMQRRSPMFGVLTNSRALPPQTASLAYQAIGDRLRSVAAELDVSVRVVSRSDSCLRGHFPGEPETLARALRPRQRTPILLCPAFPQAGRVTFDDTHWVRQDGALVGAAHTEYAADPAFGYRESNLVEWVRARAGENAAVASLTLADIRRGLSHLTERLLTLARGDTQHIVANAVTDSDLEMLAAAADAVERQGARMIYRTGPSFLAAMLGRRPAGPLDALPAAAGGRGLIVAGSHTQLTTDQLTVALREHPLVHVPLDVREVLAGDRDRDAAVMRAADTLTEALTHSDALLATSRTAAHAGAGIDSLRSSERVADALVDITQRVARSTQLGWLVAKGGITSHDLATRALRAQRITVLGPLFDAQISVWQLGGESLAPGLRYVVFPGNVGDADLLSLTLRRLKGNS